MEDFSGLPESLALLLIAGVEIRILILTLSYINGKYLWI